MASGLKEPRERPSRTKRASDAPPGTVRRLLVSSPKGGCGKTGLSRNLAVAAALSGLNVGTLDLDKQATLTKWWGRRPEGMSAITHYQAEMVDAESIVRDIVEHDLLIIDTPTAVEEYPDKIKTLILAADFILIPTQQTVDDIESVAAWMRFVRDYGRPAAFVLNRVNRRAKSFLDAKRKLNQEGRLCPIEIPQYEDIPRAGAVGLGVMEIRGAQGGDDVTSVWQYIRSEMGL